MARYKIVIGARAESELLSVPFPHRRLIHQRIMRLRDDPRPDGWEQVGTAGGAALVVHGYELLYSIEDEALSVELVSLLRVTPT